MTAKTRLGAAAAHMRQFKEVTRGKGEWTKGSVGGICPLRYKGENPTSQAYVAAASFGEHAFQTRARRSLRRRPRRA